LTNQEKPLEKLSTFEKKETRILQKFEENGIDDYSIWSELGLLYEENQNHSKAIEIYSFVLKHAKGSLKEHAKNRLISLS
jgi:hypothetical protein